MISDSLLSLALNFIGFLSCFNHEIYMLFDKAHVVAHRFNHCHILTCNLIGFFFREKILDFVNIIKKNRLIASCDGENMVHSQIAENTCLNLDFLCVDFPLHLVASLQFHLGEHTGFIEHVYRFFCEIRIKDFWSACFAIETTASSFCLPFIAITVAIEMNWLGFDNELTDFGEQRVNESFTFCDRSINLLLKFAQLLSNSSIESNHCRSTVGA